MKNQRSRQNKVKNKLIISPIKIIHKTTKKRTREIRKTVPVEPNYKLIMIIPKIVCIDNPIRFGTPINPDIVYEVKGK